MEPESKKILIIGATGGIGSAIARSLARPEIHLVLHGTNGDTLESLTNILAPTCASATSYAADLTNEESARLFCNHVTATAHEPFDWIIYCAGFIDETEPHRLISANSALKTFTINVLSAHAIIQACESTISNQGGVLLISSTAGLWGNGEYPVYAASKAALNNLGKSLAKRWGNNKKAIVICPGPTNTAMREKIAHDAETHQSPLEIGKLVSKIISDAQTYSSGTIIQIRNSEVTRIQE